MATNTSTYVTDKELTELYSILTKEQLIEMLIEKFRLLDRVINVI